MKTVDSLKLAQKERYSILEAAQALKSDLPVTRVILFGSKAREFKDLIRSLIDKPGTANS